MHATLMPTLIGERPNAKTSYLTETVLSNNIIRNRIDLSFKDSPEKPIGLRPLVIDYM